MFNTLKKRIENEKGLSLVELLAVIVILAIVAAIAIPAIGNIIANSKAKSEISDAIQILNAAKMYELDGNKIEIAGVNQNDTTLKTYVDVTDRIKSFIVTNIDGTYKIAFTGEQIGSVEAKTVDELSKLEIEKGKIKGSVDDKKDDEQVE